MGPVAVTDIFILVRAGVKFVGSSVTMLWDP